MMTIRDIETLVGKGESATLEFKKTTGQLERGMETLCAFLNGNGGCVLYGVWDNGAIKGQQVADSTKRTIAECLNQFEPFPIVNVDYVSLDESAEKQIIAVSVSGNSEKPYCYKGRAYSRTQTTTSVMSQSQYNDLLTQRNWGGLRWEQKTNPNITLADLDEEEIRRTVRVGIEKGRLPESSLVAPLPDTLTRMELMADGKLTNAAVVLYTNRARMDYAQCQLKLARFRGTTRDEFVDNKQIGGNAFKLLDEAMAFFFKHLSLSGVVRGMIREEELTVPYKALREAVVNALCHREYNTIGVATTIAIYDDRVEINNLGRFPSQFDFSNSLDAPLSVPHNPLIAQSFYYRELFESWGRGIKLMADECRKHKVPMPEFHAFENNLVSTVFHIPEDVVLMENEHKSAPDDYENDYEKERDEHKNDYEKEDVDYENDRENERRNDYENERRNDTKKQTKNDAVEEFENERNKDEKQTKKQTKNEHRNEHRNDTKKQTKNDTLEGFENERNKGEKQTKKQTKNDTKKQTKKRGKDLDDLIVKLMVNDPSVSYDELGELTGWKKNTIWNHIKQLQEMGKIRRVGPKKGGHWEFADPKTE